MRTIEIFGKNYAGKWDRTRIACRGIVIRDGRILLSHETATDTWMIPGGGLEGEESESECCLREVAEETGVILRLSPCALEIREYYGNCRYLSRYFTGTAAGQCGRKLTESEKQAGLEPCWLPLRDASALFARREEYAGSDEMKRGLYLREHTALAALFGG